MWTQQNINDAPRIKTHRLLYGILQTNTRQPSSTPFDPFEWQVIKMFDTPNPKSQYDFLCAKRPLRKRSVGMNCLSGGAGIEMERSWDGFFGANLVTWYDFHKLILPPSPATIRESLQGLFRETPKELKATPSCQGQLPEKGMSQVLRRYFFFKLNKNSKKRDEPLDDLPVNGIHTSWSKEVYIKDTLRLKQDVQFRCHVLNPRFPRSGFPGWEGPILILGGSSHLLGLSILQVSLTSDSAAMTQLHPQTLGWSPKNSLFLRVTWTQHPFKRSQNLNHQVEKSSLQIFGAANPAIFSATQIPMVLPTFVTFKLRHHSFHTKKTGENFPWVICIPNDLNVWYIYIYTYI